MSKPPVCLTLALALAGLACASNKADSSESGTESETESETGESGESETDEEPGACASWPAHFEVVGSATVDPSATLAGAAVLLPTAPDAAPELFVSTNSGLYGVGYGFRVRVANTGVAETLGPIAPTPKIAHEIFAFDDLLITSDGEEGFSGDVGLVHYGGSIWAMGAGTIELEQSFPEWWWDGGALPMAAASTAPGVIDIYFSVVEWEVHHWRLEAGQLDEVLGSEVPPASSALLLADLDGDSFVDLISAQDGGVHVYWADAQGVSFEGSTTLDFPAVLSLVAGNIDGDPALELVAVARDAEELWPSWIRVFDKLPGEREFVEVSAEKVGVMLGLETPFGGFGVSMGRPRVHLEDLDGDGLDDLLYVDAEYLGQQAFGPDYGDHRVVARRSCGDGSLAGDQVLYESELRIADVHVADFSQDGAPDLLVFESRDTVLVTLEQQ